MEQNVFFFSPPSLNTLTAIRFNISVFTVCEKIISYSNYLRSRHVHLNFTLKKVATFGSHSSRMNLLPHFAVIWCMPPIHSQDGVFVFITYPL